MWPPVSRRPPRLIILLLATAVCSAIALAWSGWTFVRQDRELERQRVVDRAETTATLVAAAVERGLAGLERRLPAFVASGPDALRARDAIAVRIQGGGDLMARSGSPILWSHVPAATHAEPPASTWVGAERMEFATGRLLDAELAYRLLARSGNTDVRAGALVRLARVLKREGRADEALSAYAEMAQLRRAVVLGDPADLMARWARVELLGHMHRDGEARAEVGTLDTDLRGGRWTLDRTRALMYIHALDPWRTEVDQSVIDDAIVLLDAVDSAMPGDSPSDSTSATRGQRSVRTDGRTAFVMWSADGDDRVVFAATSGYLVRMWSDFLNVPNMSVALVDDTGGSVIGRVPNDPSAPVAVRSAADIHLPWTIRVTATGVPVDIASATRGRRAAILAALGALALMTIVTAYLAGRAVIKELALARQQAEFVSAVSHEFRSPLTSLTHLTSLLRSDFHPSDARRRQYYDALATDVDRLRRFVETLLDFGRIKAGAARYDFVPVDLRALAGACVDEFKRLPAGVRHPVSLVIADAVPAVSADSEALGRALWNLLENAAKYSPDDQPIVVRIEPDGPAQVAIRVMDHGRGIPTAEQAHIFEQFFRGAEATKSAVKGTGVGLAIVQHIVVGHGGVVGLESNEGQGSTFSIILPAREAAEPNRARRVS
jgi:signal transduction histidine kinase